MLPYQKRKKDWFPDWMYVLQIFNLTLDILIMYLKISNQILFKLI